MKRLISKGFWQTFIIFLLGGVAIAGLESSVTNISDLNTAWPLGSDLASTGDDHMRNIKKALKNDLPNMNGTWNSAAAPFLAMPDNTTTGIYEPSANAIGFATSGNAHGSISSAGAWSIPAPSSAGVGLTVTGISNSYTETIQSGATSSQGFGLRVQAGTNSSDVSVLVNNAANNASYFEVGGAGGVIVGNPANATSSAGNLSMGGISSPLLRIQDSGVKGVILDLQATNTGININSNFVTGPVQNINLQSNGTTVFSVGTTSAPTLQGYGPTAAGLVDMTPDKGTFTATITGCTTAPTGTATWSKNGNQVTIFLPGITCTSNTTALTYTGLPAALEPVTTQNINLSTLVNNTGIVSGWAQMANGSTSITFSVAAVGGFVAANWTNSGSKGLAGGATISYTLL